MLLSYRSVQITLAIWAVSNIFVLLMSHNALPFYRPAFSGKSADLQLLLGNVALLGFSVDGGCEISH